MKNTKLRKELLGFGVVNSISINIEKLASELRDSGLFNCEWTAASNTVDEPENLFIKANSECKARLNGSDIDGYVEVNLAKPHFTDFQLNENDVVREKSMIYRLKRLDSTRPEYSQHADETRFSVDDQYIKGELARIFEYFKGTPCRVRIANLKSGKRLNPHVDYDPSYIFRYHVPLITHVDCKLYTQNNGVVYETHMEADGRMYWLNTGLKHWVINNSSIDRYHLLLDVTGNSEVENKNKIEFYSGDVCSDQTVPGIK